MKTVKQISFKKIMFIFIFFGISTINFNCSAGISDRIPNWLSHPVQTLYKALNCPLKASPQIIGTAAEKMAQLDKLQTLLKKKTTHLSKALKRIPSDNLEHANKASSQFIDGIKSVKSFIEKNACSVEEISTKRAWYNPLRWFGSAYTKQNSTTCDFQMHNSISTNGIQSEKDLAYSKQLFSLEKENFEKFNEYLKNNVKDPKLVQDIKKPLLEHEVVTTEQTKKFYGALGEANKYHYKEILKNILQHPSTKIISGILGAGAAVYIVWNLIRRNARNHGICSKIGNFLKYMAAIGIGSIATIVAIGK